MSLEDFITAVQDGRESEILGFDFSKFKCTVEKATFVRDLPFKKGQTLKRVMKTNEKCIDDMIGNLTVTYVGKTYFSVIDEDEVHISLGWGYAKFFEEIKNGI